MELDNLVPNTKEAKKRGVLHLDGDLVSIILQQNTNSLQ